MILRLRKDSRPNRQEGAMTRPRFAFLIKLSLLIFARVTVAVDEPPRPAQPSGEVYAEELKDLKIRQQAETLDLLVGKTNPRFVWNGGDMLWVEHNEAGKVMLPKNLHEIKG
jgi:hypothetical protein